MRRFLFKVILAIVLIGALLVYWFFFNVFSSGERKGTLVKMTKKGNVFKTIEGEMWLSCRQVVNADKFYFSVTDEAVADSLMHMQDECIQVTYKQYRSTLSWRGDSKYVVVGFQHVR
ncbi:MAG TPA: hypothetical protein VM012_04590 [Flavitalea sp.]|nr:hypothetical protein [Flavitalea sp.]